MVEWLPPTAQSVVLALPMVHGVEWIRHGYFGEVVRTHENPAYLVVSGLFLVLIGLALVKDTSRRLEPQ